jgi:hypothetical protein
MQDATCQQVTLMVFVCGGATTFSKLTLEAKEKLVPASTILRLGQLHDVGALESLRHAIDNAQLVATSKVARDDPVGAAQVLPQRGLQAAAFCCFLGDAEGGLEAFDGNALRFPLCCDAAPCSHAPQTLSVTEHQHVTEIATAILSHHHGVLKGKC